MGNVALYFGNEEFPLYKDSYSLAIENKETQNETEAGTIIRDIKRLGVPHLSISQAIDDTWYKKLFDYDTSGVALTISYYDPSTRAQATFSGFIENLKFDLVADNTSTYWKASFEVKAY